MQAQDLPTAPALSGSLVRQDEPVTASAFQLFPPGGFDLAEKAVTFTPLQQQQYQVSTDSMAELLDWEAGWGSASDVVFAEIGSTPFCMVPVRVLLIVTSCRIG